VYTRCNTNPTQAVVNTAPGISMKVRKPHHVPEPCLDGIQRGVLVLG